jgi:hypothetical protein
MLVRKREPPSQMGAYAITRFLDVAEFYLSHVLLRDLGAATASRISYPASGSGPVLRLTTPADDRSLAGGVVIPARLPCHGDCVT